MVQVPRGRLVSSAVGPVYVDRETGGFANPIHTQSTSVWVENPRRRPFWFTRDAPFSALYSVVYSVVVGMVIMMVVVELLSCSAIGRCLPFVVSNHSSLRRKTV